MPGRAVRFAANGTVPDVKDEHSHRPGSDGPGSGKVDETGLQASEPFKSNMPIQFDDILPRYQDTLSPQIPIQFRRRPTVKFSFSTR
jgi:hypothetical protein